MLKNFSASLFISLIAVMCFIFGYISGEASKKERLTQTKELTEKYLNAMSSILDGSMYSSEPYNSYAMSIMLFESSVESKESPEKTLNILQGILLKEIKERKSGVSQYCESRATSSFRTQCARKIEQAEELLKTHGENYKDF